MVKREKVEANDLLEHEPAIMSEDERERAQLVGEVAELWVKTKGFKDDGYVYGAAFDRFFDKKISELVSLKRLYNMPDVKEE